MLENLLDRAYLIRGVTLAHDFAASFFAFLLAVSLRVGLEGLEPYWLYGVWFAAIATCAGYSLGLNRGVWRYASLSDLEAVIKTALVSVVLFALWMVLSDRYNAVPRSSLLASGIILIITLGGPRMAYRMWRNWRSTRSNKAAGVRNALLIGSSDTAELFIKATSEQAELPYRIVGVLDERGRRRHRSIRGVDVLGTSENLKAILEKLARRDLAVASIILTSEDLAAGNLTFDRAAEAARENQIELLRLPNISRLKSGLYEAGALSPQPIVLEDLLPRRPVSLNQDSLIELIEGAVIAVTGAGGSIGSELCRQVFGLKPKRLIVTDFSEALLYEIEQELRSKGGGTDIVTRICDVRDRADVHELFADFKPEVVFHAAALKHVPVVEAQPLQGLATNVLGSRNVADAALVAGARAMVLVSTDKAVNPTNVMGATKRMAEAYCQALDLRRETRFVTVRFGNVLGSAGSVIPKFEKQIKAGGPVEVTHPEMERYFMTIPEAVQLVLHATSHGVASQEVERGRIFVLDMGQPVKILDVARKMIRLAGLRPDEDIKVKIIGLRPGEKLFEELFDAEEAPVATNVNGVLAAMPRTRLDSQSIANLFDELADQLDKRDLREAMRILQRVVPEYVAGRSVAPNFADPKLVRLDRPIGQKLN